jgi:hypothetical protein
VRARPARRAEHGAHEEVRRLRRAVAPVAREPHAQPVQPGAREADGGAEAPAGRAGAQRERADVAAARLREASISTAALRGRMPPVTTALRPARTRALRSAAVTTGATTIRVRDERTSFDTARTSHDRVAGNSAAQLPSAALSVVVTGRQPFEVAIWTVTRRPPTPAPAASVSRPATRTAPGYANAAAAGCTVSAAGRPSDSGGALAGARPAASSRSRSSCA